MAREGQQVSSASIHVQRGRQVLEDQWNLLCDPHPHRYSPQPWPPALRHSLQPDSCGNPIASRSPNEARRTDPAGLSNNFSSWPCCWAVNIPGSVFLPRIPSARPSRLAARHQAESASERAATVRSTCRMSTPAAGRDHRADLPKETRPAFRRRRRQLRSRHPEQPRGVVGRGTERRDLHPAVLNIACQQLAPRGARGGGVDVPQGAEKLEADPRGRVVQHLKQFLSQGRRACQTRLGQADSVFP